MNFQKIDNAPWIDRAQETLPFELPKCFSEFMRGYVFTDLEIKCLHHYDNYDGNENWCWQVALHRDTAIFDVCIQNGFLPIGQPDSANYDRICLDINRLKRGDCPVVQIDHEMILLRDKIKIVEEIAPSYRNLIANVLEAYHQLDQKDA